MSLALPSGIVNMPETFAPVPVTLNASARPPATVNVWNINSFAVPLVPSNNIFAPDVSACPMKSIPGTLALSVLWILRKGVADFILKSVSVVTSPVPAADSSRLAFDADDVMESCTGSTIGIENPTNQKFILRNIEHLSFRKPMSIRCSFVCHLSLPFPQ